LNNNAIPFYCYLPTRSCQKYETDDDDDDDDDDDAMEMKEWVPCEP